MGDSRKDRSKGHQASLKDVAAEAGVSMAAVSYALNGKIGVADDTRDRIMDAVTKLNYQPRKFARRMRTGKSDAIGLLVPDLSNPFFPEFARSVERAARTAGKSVFLVDTDNDPATELAGIRTLVAQGVDGIIWWPTSQENCLMFQDSDVPIVFVDSKFEGRDAVTSDHWNGGRLVAELVLEAGCKRIGLIRGPHNFQTSQSRRDGFVENLRPDFEIIWEIENAFAPPLCDAILAAVGRNEVDVIVCPNDLIAFEILKILREDGVSVPRDVSVTGFGGIVFSDLITPRLTTVRQPLSELGTEAVALLSRRILDPAADPRDILLPVEIIERDSVRAQSQRSGQ